MTFIKGEPRPPNAGRKKGSRNKRTVALAEASHEAIRSGSTPLDFLLQVLRDPAKDDRLRLDAAKAAAPYCHQRLTVAEDANRTQWDDPEKSSDQIRADLDRLLAEMGVPEAIRKAVLWGDKACPGRRTRHGPPGEGGGLPHHLRLDPLHRPGPDAEAGGDLVHALVAIGQRGADVRGAAVLRRPFRRRIEFCSQALARRRTRVAVCHQRTAGSAPKSPSRKVSSTAVRKGLLNKSTSSVSRPEKIPCSSHALQNLSPSSMASRVANSSFGELPVRMISFASISESARFHPPAPFPSGSGSQSVITA
jgi:hypothetical protein